MPHFDYENIINGQAYNTVFQQKIESIQYGGRLTRTGPI